MSVISSEAQRAQSRYLLIINICKRSLHSLCSVEMTRERLSPSFSRFSPGGQIEPVNLVLAGNLAE